MTEHKRWPLKLVAGAKSPQIGEQLYLTNAPNGVAYIYREEQYCTDPEMEKIGFIPASANPLLLQRELPLKAILVRVPLQNKLSSTLDDKDNDYSYRMANRSKEEWYVTTENAETKEERANRLYTSREYTPNSDGYDKNAMTNFVKDTILYKRVPYVSTFIPDNIKENIEIAQTYTIAPNISNNIGGNTKSVTLSESIKSSTSYGVPFIANELSTMKEQQTMISQILQINKNAAEQAAHLELGRVANATLETILAKKFPNLPSTPFNALVIANLASVIGKQVKPSPKLEKLTNAMVTSAYGEVFQMLDLEGMIKELLDAVGDKLVD